MQQVAVFIFICLPIFQSIQSKGCFKAGKLAALTFLHYPGSPKVTDQIKATVNILSQSQVDDMYILNGTPIDPNSLLVSHGQCVRVRGKRTACLANFRSSYMTIQPISGNDCVMNIKGVDNRLKSILDLLITESFPKKYNLTCIINYIPDTTTPPPFPVHSDDKVVARLTIYLCLFAAVICISCLAWIAWACRRCIKRYIIYRQERKQFQINLKETLDELPMIIFNSTVTNQDFPGDGGLICTICSEPFRDNDKLRKLMCSHYFHMRCIDRRVLLCNRCPICNLPIFNDDIRSISGELSLNDEGSVDPTVLARNSLS